MRLDACSHVTVLTVDDRLIIKHGYLTPSPKYEERQPNVDFARTSLNCTGDRRNKAPTHSREARGGYILKAELPQGALRSLSKK